MRLWMEILLSEEQPVKACFSIFVTVEGISMLLRFLQWKNIPALILLIPVPRVTLFKLGQRENIASPMLVTEFGIVIVVRFVQSSNTKSPIVVTDSGITRVLRPAHPRNALLLISVIVSGSVIDLTW